MALKLRRRPKAAPQVSDDGLVQMSLVEHRAELRRRVMISVLGITGGAVVGFLLYNRILAFLQEPYCELKRSKNLPGTCNFVITDPLEGVTTRFKVSAYVGLVIALPIVLWQLWRFITPGLHPKEKKYAIPFVLSSILLFLAGAAVAILTFPQALDFLISVSGNNVETLFGPAKYISLYTLIMLAFLEIANILTPAKLMRSWRLSIVGITVFAAVITPSQDPYSMLVMAVPMVIFYFASAGIGKLLGK
jgi:sec-independent protein translocase protein TatC